MRFFVVGDVSVDLIYLVDRLPAAGEEAVARRALFRPGGAGATMAAQLASLGHTAFLASRVGTGPFRELALSGVRDAGVDLKYLQEDPEVATTSILVFLLPGGERTMVAYAGASRHLDAEGFKPRSLDTMDAFLLSAYALIGGPQRAYALKALSAAKKRKLPTFIDLGTGAVREVGEALLPTLAQADYLLMNEGELLSLTGAGSISEGVARLREAGIERVVVKVGPMGAIVATPEEEALVEPVEVDEVVDTTGAGDAFTAAFAHGVMQGLPLVEAARLGNIAGALATTAVGAQGRLVSPEDLAAYAHAP